MARRYVRDNRGRFASSGATARGGRLRTAAGNKRATVTQRLKGPGGRIAKPKGLKPMVGKKPAQGLSSSAIMERAPLNRIQSGSRVTGNPTRALRFGTKAVGADGRVQSKQAVKPQNKKGRRVYVSNGKFESSRSTFQRMKDGNYAVTITTIGARPPRLKSVNTLVAPPAKMRRLMRFAVQDAALMGAKRTGTARVGRRVM